MGPAENELVPPPVTDARRGAEDHIGMRRIINEAIFIS
jgi:hypothetical protein